MNNDGDTSGRRARLRTMRERYEQQSDHATPMLPAARVTVAPTSSGRRGQAGPGQGGDRGHLLQRLVQFLTEITPGDRPIPGVPVGEQRLQQAMRMLEKRARTTQGGAGERIQRLLKFLTQDIPGEPMAAGVNVWRLQKLLERAGVASSLPGTSASERVASTHADHPPAAVQESASAITTSLVTAGEAAAPATSEIAEIEEQLHQLQTMIENLQARLDQVRRGGKVPADTLPSGAAKPPVNLPPEPAASPPSGNDDWFLEFLE